MNYENDCSLLIRDCPKEDHICYNCNVWQAFALRDERVEFEEDEK